MKIFSFEGVKTLRRGIDSAQIALMVVEEVAALRGLGVWKNDSEGVFFADLITRLRGRDPNLSGAKAKTSYQAVFRCLPFEAGGVVYYTEKGPSQGRMYERTVRLKCRAGGLEDFGETAKPVAKSLGVRVAEEMKKTLGTLPIVTRTELSDMETRLSVLILDTRDDLNELRGSGKDGTPDDVSEAMASIRMSFTDLYAQTAKLQARLQTLEDKIALF